MTDNQYIVACQELADAQQAVKEAKARVKTTLAATPLRKRPPRVDGIVSRVAEKYNLTRRHIYGRNKEPHIMRARQEAWVAVHDLLGVSYAQVGRYFDRSGQAIADAVRAAK